MLLTFLLQYIHALMILSDLIKKNNSFHKPLNCLKWICITIDFSIVYDDWFFVLGGRIGTLVINSKIKVILRAVNTLNATVETEMKARFDIKGTYTFFSNTDTVSPPERSIPLPSEIKIYLKNWKENLTGLGLKPDTSGLPYQCSSIWAIQPLDGGPHSQPVFAGMGAPVRSYNPCCCISPGIAPPLSFRCKQPIVVNLATAARGSPKLDCSFFNSDKTNKGKNDWELSNYLKSWQRKLDWTGTREKSNYNENSTRIITTSLLRATCIYEMHW